jgi:hypothetical protein
MLAVERRREVAPATRERDVTDDSWQAVDMLSQVARRGLEEVNPRLRSRCARPSAGGDEVAFGVDGDRVHHADIPRPGRQADASEQPAVFDRPDPDCLILGAGYCMAASGIDVSADDRCRVHVRIQDQRRPVVEAGRLLREHRRRPGQRQKTNQLEDEMSAKAGISSPPAGSE